MKCVRADLNDRANLAGQGYDYVVVSSSIYDRFFAEAERYPKEVEFYQTLFAQGKLVEEIAPTYWMAGPTIRIYEPFADR